MVLGFVSEEHQQKTLEEAKKKQEEVAAGKRPKKRFSLLGSPAEALAEDEEEIEPP
eukprot:CAMPEP_0116865558 /NCGR_PEP_ID=MMETSP0418-20121206/25510_1 /TAXON_ID=1158023 /ORGANISM="Astrosyne radiata, Strain 13vi08-1A" /LENGTH=55 /DNA_ID=CAMNT_0004501035 /DNA_START=18 /DNA_END=182 /DNA_ORIENTATION=+